MGMFEEKEVVSRIIAGDLKAFKSLVGQYEALVFHVVYRLIENTEDAEDVCQETFLRVYKGIHQFAFQSKLSTWIASIAYNTTVNYLKKKEAVGMLLS
jgi:RNA polymerase sigma factor (sigma-70 family)